ncbi:acetylornithine/succinylornithine family transaminase [Buchnera aphidicola (Thelaxes californica)]|uniref:Acetylornithine/succinylornithine family transaminase n=1 Tax=Buchnera aphidicola (Thelaxes californica) TaxID=1315998 RepID=A0A4D6YLT1_9GAMM|nr:acetylornithine/succinyldiaminopimelate transaminase [Buchnera aphidicola]QCI26934.1 acetylornithine/succinylornithine family transaminase [Buchnera aphidicola (Thelaxes californica)]
MSLQSILCNINTFNKVMIPFYQPRSFIPVKGKGCYLWDQQGKKYIDFSGGIAVLPFGHAHPKLNKILHIQSKKLWHISNIFTNEPALMLAKKLVDHSFADCVFFSNSGAEANEAALKIALYYASHYYDNTKNNIVSFNNSFHGRTIFTVSVGGQSKYSSVFNSNIYNKNIKHISFNNIQHIEKMINIKTCAVIIELIQGEGGVISADKSFIKKLRELCNIYDVLLIFDEVQTGIGRTGTLFAYEQYEVIPDILTTAKSLGGGFPISAVLTTNKISKILYPGLHGSTYGGNPLACSIAIVILDMINNRKLLNLIKKKFLFFSKKINKINKLYNFCEEIRGKGLLLGILLKKNCYFSITEIMYYAEKEGLILLSAGSNVIRLAPPLNISYKDINFGLYLFEKSLQKLFFKKLLQNIYLYTLIMLLY